jgi:hypothetical protein
VCYVRDENHFYHSTFAWDRLTISGTHKNNQMFTDFFFQFPLENLTTINKRIPRNGAKKESKCLRRREMRKSFYQYLTFHFRTNDFIIIFFLFCFCNSCSYCIFILREILFTVCYLEADRERERKEKS